MITLAELKTQARQRSDMENSEFVSDAEKKVVSGCFWGGLI